ncbi:autotransporter assembly complex family protein [uncultured Massilia sp.]|uniref:autotransporter assembly complex protein TamA n=1 Tax=uncultured Massilia sp. TaxID=169973 RepID=UPI0025E917FB|nr:autotransporter assembly complex family protein [uncultured Massilia sp.]
MFPARPDPAKATTPAQSRILAQIVLGVNALCLAQVAGAQDQPQAPATQATPDARTAAPLPMEAPSRAVDYDVRIEAPRALRELLEENLDLMRWRGNPRLDMEQLQRLVRVAPEQVKTLIATEGYYSPQVSAGLDTSGAKPVARIIVEPGQPVTVGDVDIELRGFAPADKGSAPVDAATLRQGWTLGTGSRFRTADWEAAKRNILRQITQRRFPRAQLLDSSATVDPDSRRALLKVVIDSGPDAQFGNLKIEGLQRYPASVITNLNQIRPGDEYSDAALQALQGRLQDTGYFSSVEVSADMSGVVARQVDELNQGAGPQASTATGPTTLPVLVRVTENKRKNVSLGVGFSTNTGARAQANYGDLLVFGKRNKSSVLYEQKRQTARTDFYWPTTSNGYNNSVGGGFDRQDVEGQITRTTSISATRAWGSPLLERSIKIEALTEQVTLADAIAPSPRVKSLPVTFSITKRSLDSLVAPTRGYSANVQLGAAPLPVLTDEKFVRLYTRGLAYKPVGDDGTLILRGEFGALGSKNKEGVPTTFLFRAGGDGSVRGYGYQELGVPVGSAITGGRYLLTASAEYDYWFKPPYGAAVFYDVGNAGDKLSDLKPEVGYGVGARWRSPVGPINVDVAYGKAVHKVRLHFSLGFTF